jgi:hypothetical protein
MDTTKSFVKIYNVAPQAAEDFEFDFDTQGATQGCSDILTELVPNLNQWGGIGWMEASEYEYNPHHRTMHLVLDTKWEAPIHWLQQASCNTTYFENKLITMSTIQKDETSCTGVAIMDGELLQNKTIWTMDSDKVGKYYNDNEPDYDLDELDNQIWDAIGKFVAVCEQFYLEKEEQNDDT